MQWVKLLLGLVSHVGVTGFSTGYSALPVQLSANALVR